MQYLQFAFLTVLCWGTYGVCMHIGSSNMGDKENGRIMAFLWVGLAYFLTAVVAPLIILKLKGGNVAFWTFPTKGWQWSLIAGTLGALGALEFYSLLVRCLHLLMCLLLCRSFLRVHRWLMQS